MKHDFTFYIDVVGACNLRCPSCAVGNTPEVKNPQGVMSPETLEQILAKATRECNVTYVGLYNWAEPLLHPRLSEMIRVVNQFGLKCFLSSNLNKVRNLEEIMMANPHYFRISLSGFNQKSYEATHKGGDIDLVKKNMRLLSEIKAKTKASTFVSVAFYRYLSNIEDELPMKHFTEQMGFKFTPMWALWLPLEKVLAKAELEGYGVISQADQAVINNLALPLDEALRAARSLNNSQCTLLEDVISLDVKGNVQLCCAVYDSRKYSITGYLESPIEEIQALRSANTTCGICTKYGVHDYYTYKAPRMNELAEKNVALYLNPVHEGRKQGSCLDN